MSPYEVGQSASFDLATAVRTLVAAGYVVTGSNNMPAHTEIKCQLQMAIGAEAKFLIALAPGRELSGSELQDIERTALSEHRALVIVSDSQRGSVVCWNDFLDALGGAIPSWRALDTEYPGWLRTAAINQLPVGCDGEAWRLFEDLVADGLEFIFGRKVRRLGGNQRGTAVSDIQAQLPDLGLLTVDAKASATGFCADWPSLRPLGEYLERQRGRQRGGGYEVVAAAFVSSGFRQEASALAELSLRFNAEYRAPVAFLTADSLADLVGMFRNNIPLRPAIRWRSMFAGGIVRAPNIGRDLECAREERYSVGEP